VEAGPTIILLWAWQLQGGIVHCARVDSSSAEAICAGVNGCHSVMCVFVGKYVDVWLACIMVGARV
jgi:hypothetical protein